MTDGWILDVHARGTEDLSNVEVTRKIEDLPTCFVESGIYGSEDRKKHQRR